MPNQIVDMDEFLAEKPEPAGQIVDMDDFLTNTGMGQTWVQEDINAGNVDISNYMQRAATRIQEYQQARSDLGQDRLTSNEQIAIVDAFRQNAGLQPEGYYLTKDGAAIPKDIFAEIRRKTTEDDIWANFKANLSSTVLQTANGIRASQARITDALGITKDATMEAARDGEEVNRILQPQGGVSGFAGQLVGNVMNLYLGGMTSAPARFASATAGSTFIDIAQRRADGQNISATTEWSAAITNAAIEYALETFGQVVARKAGASLAGRVGSLTKTISGQGIRGGIRATAGIVAKFGVEQSGLAAQGFAEESITELLQNVVRRVSYNPDQAITEGIWYAGLQGMFMPMLASPGMAAMQRYGGRESGLTPDSSSPVAGDQTLANSPEGVRASEVGDALRAEEALPVSLKPALPAEADIPDARDTKVQVSLLTDKWIGDRQVSDFKVKQNAANKQIQLKTTLREGEDLTQVNNAISVYIDMKDNSGSYTVDNIKQLTPEQQLLVERAMALSPDQQALAEQIISETRSLGIEAMEVGIIKNFRENYLTRFWKKGDIPGSRKAKFTISTPRQRQRTLPSLIEGWANGLNLEVPGAIEAQMLAGQQISQVIHDRNLIDLSLKSGVFSPIRTDKNTHVVKHPNFKKWVWAGKMEKGVLLDLDGNVVRATKAEVHGPDVFLDPDGNLYRRATMWADKKTAGYLNNALGSSELFNIKGVGEILKYNQILKHAVLTASGFHYFAILRSYMFGSRGLNPLTGYSQGRDLVLGKKPGLESLVRGGLTTGEQMGVDIAAEREATKIGKIIDKVPMASEIRKSLIALSRANSHFLFNKFGTYLKANAAYLDLQHQLKKNAGKIRDGEMTEHDLAKTVASLYNDDFGGLNLQRMGRNPTLQALHKAISLAPDWTESNVRTMVKAFKRGEEGRVYRGMWGRVLMKGIGATVIANLLVAALDDEETFFSMYKKAWNSGKLNWLDVDITPFFRMFGGQTPGRKYISIIGHFKDPLKFITQPPKSAKAKMSMLARIGWEMGDGEDWRGRVFTSFGELMASGKASQFKAFGGGPIGWEQVPSFIIKQAEQSTPVAVQALINRMRGEIDTFDMVTRSLGSPTFTASPKKPKKRSKRTQRRRE